MNHKGVCRTAQAVFTVLQKANFQLAPDLSQLSSLNISETNNPHTIWPPDTKEQKTRDKWKLNASMLSEFSESMRDSG